MSKYKNIPKSAAVPVKAPARKASDTPKTETHAFRETVESIVIAFVLAFLFRTFEAEAFVIPTGSMAPTLMGRHKDVICPQCGYRYQVSASEEESEDPRRQTSDCIAGMCPLCRYVLPMGPNLPLGILEGQRADIKRQPSYNGDRILVNKYLYTFADPKRWDVVVFKFPGDAKTNYIKRLVGLPGETLRIYQGDVFVRPPGDDKNANFAIERKPPEKFLAVRQLVHDTDHDPAKLDAAGWPLRWHAPPGDSNAWQLEKSVVGTLVNQRYSVDAKADTTTWLRYEHLVPQYDTWEKVAGSGSTSGQASPPYANVERSKLRRLITDSNPYNGREDRLRMNSAYRMVSARDKLEIDQLRQGLHWVGDLMLEADVDVQSADGLLLLDLVEGGKHFTCTIDVKTGEAKLSAAGIADYSPTAKTSVVGPGKYHVAFANVDDQLLVWIGGKTIAFESGTAFDVNKIFGDRKNILPQTSSEDLGDLAPAGIGARGAKLVVSRLQLWRDLYYIADSSLRSGMGDGVVTDFRHPYDYSLLQLPRDPSAWGRWSERQMVEFPLTPDQLFVMGDNSAESSDARLWLNSDRGRPGGAYLDRRLLIGKALCVYWPHSWNQIPGTPIPFPLFPNVMDMRLVR